MDVVEDNIHGLFGKRDLDKILEYVGAGKIDKNDVFHFNKAGHYVLQRTYQNSTWSMK